MTEVLYNQSLTVLIHGESKVGKSTLAATAPYPRLMIDVEGGHRFLPILPTYWDPRTQAPPTADGSWDTCVVQTKDFAMMRAAYQHLHTGQHQFASVIIDSISELQTKAVEDIAAREAMKTQDWGTLYRVFGGLMRDLRDLTMHSTNPLRAVVLTAMTQQGNTGPKRPFLQGQGKTIAPYLFDITGYLTIEQWPNPDPTQPNLSARRMYIEGTSEYVAGERVGGRLGRWIDQPDLNIEEMMNRIYGTTSVAAEQTTDTERK